MYIDETTTQIHNNALTECKFFELKKRDAWALKKTLSGHSDTIMHGCLIYLPNYQLASGSWDGSIKIWNLANGHCVKTLLGHRKSVACLLPLPNNLIASSSWDGTVKIWDVTSGGCVRTLGQENTIVDILDRASFRLFNTSVIRCLLLLPSGHLASGSDDETIRIWNLANGQWVRTLNGKSEYVWNLLSLQNGHLASGNTGKVIEIWDPTDGSHILTLKGHNDAIEDLLPFLGDQLISASRDNKIKIWDINKGNCIRTLSGHNSFVKRILLLSNMQLASCSWDKTIKIWDVASGDCIRTLSGHFGDVDCLEYIAANNRLVSGSDDHTIRIWNPTDGTCIVSLSSHSKGITNLLVLPDNEIVSSGDSTIKIWAETATLVERIAVLAELQKNTSVTTLNFSYGSLSYENLREIIKTLIEIFKNNKTIIKLDFSHNQLDDQCCELISKIFEHSSIGAFVCEINLSHNYLTLKSLNILLELFSKLGWRNIRVLDLSNNYIELTSNDQLERMNSQRLHAAEARIDLTGNMIISLPYDAAILELSRSLIVRSQLTIRDFLESEFVSLAKVESDGARRFELTLKTKARKLINVSMNAMELQTFNRIKSDKNMGTEAELMLYLTKKLHQRHLEMESDLLDNPLNPYSEGEQKARVKRLMDFHPDAPLSSRLVTHSVFRSDQVSEAPSILFPDTEKLTVSHGMVYLMVNNRKTDQHTLLCYEWLTDYGQRFIRVAHLTNGKKSSGLSFFSPGRIGISFEGDGPLKIKIKYLNSEHYLIAGLEAEKKKLEQMHSNIQGEEKNGVNAKYKWLIVTTSPQREDKGVAKRRVQNCCKWATDHMKDDLGIAFNISVYEPLAIVKKLRDNPAALLGGGSKLAPKI